MKENDIIQEAKILKIIAELIAQKDIKPSEEIIKHMLAINDELYRKGRTINYQDEKEEEER